MRPRARGHSRARARGGLSIWEVRVCACACMRMGVYYTLRVRRLVLSDVVFKFGHDGACLRRVCSV